MRSEKQSVRMRAQLIRGSLVSRKNLQPVSDGLAGLGRNYGNLILQR